MKFDWDKNLTDLAGKLIVDESGKPITLGHLCVQSLLTPDRREVDGLTKFTRYRIAGKIVDGDEIDVSEAATIKEVCGNTLAPLALGRVWEMLERPGC